MLEAPGVPVKCFSEVVGELQVLGAGDLNPEPLAKYLAGQLGIALQGVAVRRSQAILENRAVRLLGEIEEHKLLEKARGVIETRRLIPAGHGQRLMRKVSAQSGRKLRELAQGIVNSANRNPWMGRTWAPPRTRRSVPLE